MQIHGLMITNNADFHPADHHAEITASKIIDFGDKASGEQISAVREVRKTLETILTNHHERVETAERAALASNVSARVSSPLEADDNEVQSTVDEIVATMAKTPFANTFASAGVRDAIVDILHHESRSQMQIHRDAAMKPIQSK